MTGFRTLDQADVKGKRVLLRVDLNVPIQDGVVSDATRIERMAPTSRLIGSSLLRREDRPLLTGMGQYAGDVNLPGLLHVAVVRSVYPHARIERVALETARAMPGVVGAFALADLPEIHGTLADPVPAGVEGRSRPVLASDKVRYVGEPIAVVVADEHARLVHGARVDFVPLEGVGDVDAATRPGGPVLHDDLGSNVAGRVQRSFGDVHAQMSGDAVVVRQSFRFGRVIGGYMEPRATAAALDPHSGRLSVWTSTQWVYGVRDRIATILGLERDLVRVLAPDVGGAFGAKGQVYPEEIIVAALARRLRRPVRWVATRTEDTQATGQSHGDAAEVELAANRDGTLRGPERQYSQPPGQRLPTTGTRCRVGARVHQYGPDRLHPWRRA